VRVSERVEGRVSVLLLAATLLLVAGCETGRTHKLHSPLLSVSDETTTGKQDPDLVGNPGGQPPVPGSPTAAGPDGKQPYDSAYARSGPGAEHGTATPPAEQEKDRFVRQ